MRRYGVGGKTDARGYVTTQSYDAVGALASVQDAEGGSTACGYDKAGRRESLTDPLGRKTT